MEKDEGSKILIIYRNKVLNPVVGRETALNSKLYEGLERIINTYVKRDCNEDKISLAKPLDEDEFINLYPTIGGRVIEGLYAAFHLDGDKEILRISHLKKMIERCDKGEEFCNIGKKCIDSMRDYLVKKGIKAN